MKSPAKLKKSENAIRSLICSCVVLFALAACSQSEWREIQNPNTGDAAAEIKTGDIQPGTARAEDTAYVAPERLRARENPNQNPEETTTLLEQNDPVKIVDPTPIGDDKVVRVEISPTKKVKKQVYVPLKYLKTRPTEEISEANRYIMIQNIATEKLRVYEVSKVKGSAHRLVFEAEMIAGENDPGKTRRTALGSYKIEKWIKFYQDYQNLFPSWYDPKLTSLPLPGAELKDWTGSHLMPVVSGKKRGLVRGAFGWYTAKIGPNAFTQWTHGTVGWGADGDRYIKLPKSELAKYYSDPRSFGCTRVENRGIAYLFDLLPVGTRIVKIYAKESLADNSLKRYKKQPKAQPFEWILTNDGVRSEKPNSISKPKQILAAVSEASILETGSYDIDDSPNVALGNLYELPESAFQGEFLIDEGRFKNYKHPSELRLGGYTDGLLPPTIVKASK